MRINQLALALLHLFRRPLPDVFLDEILRPLGGGDGFAWHGYDDAWVELPGVGRVPSVPGGTHWGAGVSICARDQARIGQLLLDGGAGGGRQLVSRGWIERMTRAVRDRAVLRPAALAQPQRPRLSRRSARAAFMVGAGGHYVGIDPALDAVIVLRWLDPAHARGGDRPDRGGAERVSLSFPAARSLPMSVRPLISPRVEADAVTHARIQLAAAHRMAVLHELEEGIDNHFTMNVPGREGQYLILPYGWHWSEARASDLIVFDESGRVLEGQGSLELSAQCIHAPIHRITGAKVVMHTHQTWTIALNMLKDNRLCPRARRLPSSTARSPTTTTTPAWPPRSKRASASPRRWARSRSAS